MIRHARAHSHAGRSLDSAEKPTSPSHVRTVLSNNSGTDVDAAVTAGPPAPFLQPEVHHGVLAEQDQSNRLAGFADPAGTATSDLQRDNHWSPPSATLVGIGRLTPSVQSSTHAAASGSPSLGQASSTWESWTGTDLSLFDFGANALETPWLVGEGFDINALTSSISATGSPWGYTALPTNLNLNEADSPQDGGLGIGYQTAERRINARSVVRSQWYTHIVVQATYHYTPSSSGSQDHVDEAYRADLSNRLRPSLQDNVLPSTDFLVCWYVPTKNGLPIQTGFKMVQADSVLEYMHQAVLCQISTDLTHCPRAVVSTLFRKCPATLVYMLSWGTLCGIS